MASLKSAPGASILLLEDEANTAWPIAKWIESSGGNVVLAKCPDEAIELLHDMVYIDCTLDGLLTDYRIGERTSCRVFYEFRHEYPLAPVGFMIGKEDISITRWAKARGVHLFQKPLCAPDVSAWIKQTRAVPAQS